jgi:serine phosphatase RsbU (regulator of sigma subunit)
MRRSRLLRPWCGVFGGDFFQVIPHTDGSLLIAVGDVSGKGIAAAMLVAVLVGTIRTRADETADPAAILETLNDRLLGHGQDDDITVVSVRFGAPARPVENSSVLVATPI